MPTTRKATVGPPGLTLAPLSTASRCDAEYRGTRITVPTCTPASCARVNDASTWSGSDWSGIPPATSLTTRDRSAGATSNTLKSLSLTGREHAHAGVPPDTLCNSVTEATPGSAAIFGSGAPASTKAS